jgi:RNA recognition motif-containing protein
MEEGTKNKKTIFVGGISEEVDEAKLYEKFSTFGMPEQKPVFVRLTVDAF